MTKTTTRRSLWSTALASGRFPILMLMILVVIPGAVTGDEPPREAADLFAQAYQAIDHGEWMEAEGLMREALEKWPQCGGHARLPGMFRRPYLPRYFLGLVLFQQQKFSEALAEWEKSESQGCIQHHEKLHRELRKLRASCEEGREEVPLSIRGVNADAREGEIKCLAAAR